MVITISSTFYEDFWANTLEPYDSDCWEWQGPYNPQTGYGWVCDAAALRDLGLPGKGDGAHRVAWVLSRGILIPSGRWILHKCDNRPCVRPSHLYVGTAFDNALDRDRAERPRRRAARQFLAEAEALRRSAA
jgi:HNH endonuclease